jgi:membrane fusion protein (multidrug efflux system)
VLRTFVSLVVVVALGAAVAGAYWKFVALPEQQAGGGGGGPPAGFAVPVEAAPVRVGPAESTVTAVGTMLSNESVVLKPEVDGRIVSINFDEGAPVETGRVMFGMEDSIEQAELAQAEAELALAQTNFGRAEKLVAQRAGTERALDEARAQLRTAEANIELAKARLAKMHLLAPFDGVAGLRMVSIGDYVSSGTDLVNLEQIDPLKVDFRVPEVFLAALRPGQRIQVRIDAFPDQTFTGEVYAINPALDAEGRAIVIRARIGNPDRQLRPGLFVRVTLTLAERLEALWVPEEAIVPQGQDQFVFTVLPGKVEDDPPTVQFAPVRTGKRKAGEVEIVEGLEPDARVVTAGVMKIRDGAPVQVVPSVGEAEETPVATTNGGTGS